MLVLSRRQGEKLLFPGFNTAVQVVAVKSGAVRLGIEAPPEVIVLREGIAARAEVRGRAQKPAADDGGSPTLCQLSHLLRDWLDVAAIGLALLRRQALVGSAGARFDPFDRAVGTLRNQMQGMGRHRLPKSQILLVEDDRSRREPLAGLLHRAGLAVATAGDGCDALDYLSSHSRPDVVLLDMGLPQPCDSPTLVAKIRADAAHTGLKIYGVAGGSEEAVPPGGGRGINHWFNTPLDGAELLNGLEQELADVV